MLAEFMTSPTMVAYLATYGIWGVTGPVLGMLAPILAYAMWRG